MVYLWSFYNMVKKKKNIKHHVLVTGGTGFIGSSIVRYLINNNYKVTVYDNNSSKLNRLKDLRNKIDFIKGDIRNKEVQLVKGNIHTIIHLAYVNGTVFL